MWASSFIIHSLNDSGHPSAGEPQFGPDDPRRARVLSVVDPRFAIFNTANIIKPTLHILLFLF